jgi:hypothetical protein
VHAHGVTSLKLGQAGLAVLLLDLSNQIHNLSTLPHLTLQDQGVVKNIL